MKALLILINLSYYIQLNINFMYMYSNQTKDSNAHFLVKDINYRIGRSLHEERLIHKSLKQEVSAIETHIREK